MATTPSSLGGLANRQYMCVQLNLEAFLWKCRDLQITYFTIDTSGTLISSTENAGRVTIKGIDADFVLKPTRTTTLSAKVQYLDAKYYNLNLFTASRATTSVARSPPPGKSPAAHR